MMSFVANCTIFCSTFVVIRKLGVIKSFQKRKVECFITTVFSSLSSSEHELRRKSSIQLFSALDVNLKFSSTLVACSSTVKFVTAFSKEYSRCYTMYFLGIRVYYCFGEGFYYKNCAKLSNFLKVLYYLHVGVIKYCNIVFLFRKIVLYLEDLCRYDSCKI